MSQGQAPLTWRHKLPLCFTALYCSVVVSLNLCVSTLSPPMAPGSFLGFLVVNAPCPGTRLSQELTSAGPDGVRTLSLGR